MIFVTNVRYAVAGSTKMNINRNHFSALDLDAPKEVSLSGFAGNWQSRDIFVPLWLHP